MSALPRFSRRPRFLPGRRQVLRWPLAGAWAGGLASLGLSQSWGADTRVSGDSAPVRLALLVGNRAYPSPFDLPPIHKNVRDLQAVLEKRGFKITSAVDQGPADLRRVIQQFVQEVQAAPANATVLFYFTGHGLQVEAENLLLGSGANPSANEPVLLDSSLLFRRDVIDALPRRPEGLTITVIDACRTNLRAALKAGDGLNQVEAPLGCLLAFSTGAGKPAISPSVETQNTFYTASLVKILSTASDDITFSDMFRRVKLDVQQTMLNHPVSAIRQMAQFPFIAENVRTRTRLALRAPTEDDTQINFGSQDESKLWQELEACTWPADVIRMAADYLKRFPKSSLADAAEVAREGAGDPEEAMRRNDVGFYRSAFFPKSDNRELMQDIRKAARGDKDAAARIARLYRQGDSVGKDTNRYEGWMQFAAALGNGIASYELAIHYRNQDQPLLASQFESRARELGYTPPPTLDHSRK